MRSGKLTPSCLVLNVFFLSCLSGEEGQNKSCSAVSLLTFKITMLLLMVWLWVVEMNNAAQIAKFCPNCKAKPGRHFITRLTLQTTSGRFAQVDGPFDGPVDLFQAQVIAKSIGQAFNVAYQEFLRQNGLTDEVIEDAEYNGVLEAQKILGEDLSLLADESNAKEVG